VLARKTVLGTGPGRCTWKLLKGSTGKQLVLTVTIRARGATLTRPYVFKVG
jgi:hypothetical protein